MQEYARVGLVMPTSKTEGGYWLYDNAAIYKLILIKIYVKCGYKRKTIKEILESPALDIMQEFDNLIETLEEKRKDISGMINTIKAIKFSADLPDSTLQALGNFDVTHLYQSKSFSDNLKYSIEHTANFNDIEFEESKPFIQLFYRLIAIGSRLDIPPYSDSVQSRVKELYDYMMKLIYLDEADGEDDKPISYAQNISDFVEAVNEMLEDEDMKPIIQQQCGKKSLAYIAEAIQNFEKNNGNGEINGRKGRN